jgi:MerR family copper efflux transcriptional regulator
MFISELAKKTGLTCHTIRFYEEQGLLDRRHVRRGENNYRYYSDEAIERLRLIKQAQATGFTIVELKELAEAYDAGSLTLQQQAVLLRRKVDAIGRKLAELERVHAYLISKLTAMEQQEMLRADGERGSDREQHP